MTALTTLMSGFHARQVTSFVPSTLSGFPPNTRGYRSGDPLFQEARDAVHSIVCVKIRDAGRFLAQSRTYSDRYHSPPTNARFDVIKRIRELFSTELGGKPF